MFDPIALLKVGLPAFPILTLPTLLIVKRVSIVVKLLSVAPDHQ